MDLVYLHPYHLRITDPLTRLAESRSGICQGFESKSIPPIFVFPSEDGLLVFNGNKRTIVARELGRGVWGYVLWDDEDVQIAQKEEPRLVPPEIKINYCALCEHLRKRANEFSRMNEQYSPIPLYRGRQLPLAGFEEFI